jgi:glycosyltransferase involved in cell wall biosynthesis
MRERNMEEERDYSPRPVRSLSIAVVVPAFKVVAHIHDVVNTVPGFVSRVYVVDDACPEGSGRVVEGMADPRVTVVYNGRNRGVGGAVMAGYAAALEDGHDIIVKIDGDGQMDPDRMLDMIAPIADGEADYTKGNRFYDLTYIGNMPRVRIVGNALLSFLAKASTGYWDNLDPTNGYTAIHADALRRLEVHKISERYFFETDILFRLNLARAVVVDVPIDARYGDEVSNLRISRIVGEFAYKHTRNAFKRVFYNYFLRDFTIASVELVAGSLLVLLGTAFGLASWAQSFVSGTTTPAGTVMLAALPIMLGLQLLLAFLAYDIARVPKRPISRNRHRTWSVAARRVGNPAGSNQV